MAVLAGIIIMGMIMSMVEVRMALLRLIITMKELELSLTVVERETLWTQAV